MVQPIKFYYYLLSQPSRALYILLKLNKVPAEFHPVALHKKAHLTPEFKQINRFGKVPCIVDNDFKLAESIAILRYLDARGMIDDQWYPKEIHARARTDEYLAWQHNNTRLACTLYTVEKFLKPVMTGRDPEPKKLAKIKETMENTLDSIENIWLENNKYITGSDINAADIFAASEIIQTRMVGYEPTNGRPKLDAWLKTVRNDLNPYYDEANNVMDKVSKSSGIILTQIKVVNFFRNLFRKKK